MKKAGDRDNGKPNLTAIVILSDIVYWYKPTEVREETHPTPVPSKSGRGQTEKGDITPVEVENEGSPESKGGAVPFQRERVSLLKEGEHPAGGTIIAKNHPRAARYFLFVFPSDESITEK